MTRGHKRPYLSLGGVREILLSDGHSKKDIDKILFPDDDVSPPTIESYSPAWVASFLDDAITAYMTTPEFKAAIRACIDQKVLEQTLRVAVKRKLEAEEANTRAQKRIVDDLVNKLT